MARRRIDPVVWRPARAPDRARRDRASGRCHRCGCGRAGCGRRRRGLRRSDLHRCRRRSPDPAVARRHRRAEVVAGTGGRPLGVEVDRDGRLIVCDAERGLLRVDPGTGRVETLVAAGTPIDGAPLRVCNNAAVAADGTIYFSDSSQRFGLEHWKADLLEHSGTGRLLRWGADGSSDVLLTGLHFANGVALSPGRVVRGRRRDRRLPVDPQMADGPAGGWRRPPGRQPAGVPRQPRQRKRRPDLDRHGLAEEPTAGPALASASDAAPGGLGAAGSPPAEAGEHRLGPGRRHRRAGRARLAGDRARLLDGHRRTRT